MDRSTARLDRTLAAGLARSRAALAGERRLLRRCVPQRHRRRGGDPLRPTRRPQGDHLVAALTLRLSRGNCCVKQTNREDIMRGHLNSLVAVLATLAAAALAAAPAAAQGGPIKVGFLTVDSGPLAAGGKQMEQGIQLFLKERNG